MKALKVIIMVILAIVVLLLIIGLFLPKNVHIERSTTIDAPAKVVFNQVNHLQSWPNWSPWIEEDPEIIQTYEGPAKGVGAKYSWEMSGGQKGILTIMESTPYEKIVNDLDFYEQGGATGTWAFVETDGTTKVTWGMDMEDFSYPVEVYFGALMDMMMKPYFDKGLTNLKTYCEDLPEEEVAAITEVMVEPTPAISIKDSTLMEGMADKMAELYTELGAYVKEAGVEMAGPPYSIYYNWNPEGYTAIEAGFPITGEVEGKGRINVTQSPGGKVVTISHFGNYATLDNSWNSIDEYIKENEKVIVGAPWEVYLTDPTVELDTSKWVTQICYPVQ